MVVMSRKEEQSKNARIAADCFGVLEHQRSVVSRKQKSKQICVDDFVRFMNILNKSGFLYVPVHKTHKQIMGYFFNFTWNITSMLTVNINSSRNKRITVVSLYTVQYKMTQCMQTKHCPE